jgi:hypothetical protein
MVLVDATLFVTQPIWTTLMILLNAFINMLF